jgi:hypothetical protein
MWNGDVANLLYKKSNHLHADFCRRREQVGDANTYGTYTLGFWLHNKIIVG